MNDLPMAMLDTNQTEKGEEGWGPGEDVLKLAAQGPPRDTNGASRPRNAGLKGANRKDLPQGTLLLPGNVTGNRSSATQPPWRRLDGQSPQEGPEDYLSQCCPAEGFGEGRVRIQPGHLNLRAKLRTMFNHRLLCLCSFLNIC